MGWVDNRWLRLGHVEFNSLSFAATAVKEKVEEGKRKL
jgi:hypothetical protein